MRSLSVSRIALIAVAIAVVTYLPAVRNGWALDDAGVIELNDRAHGIEPAIHAFFQPYWPTTEGRSGGLYRPLVIASYGVDWSLAGGRPWLAHLMNVLWHGLVTGLLVLVAAAWLSGGALLVAGAVFALHPVHVEAVANVVGRAELMAAAAVLGAVLTARRHRAAEGAGRGRWAALTVGIVVLGLLAKESAIVALPIIALDGAFTRGRRRADAGLYLALVALAMAWLYLWRAVAGAYVLDTMAAPFRGLGMAERSAMMLPVLLDVIRLLTWPFDLASDYDPQMIATVTTVTWQGVVGAVAALAVLVLAVRLRRRVPAVAMGVFAGVLAWGPTANFLMPSGIVLAERTLYLPSIAVAMAAGAVTAWTLGQAPDRRRLLGLGGVLLGLAWLARVETRIPFWRDTRTVVVQDYLDHPENYRTHVRAGGVYQLIGDTSSAFREFRTASTLWDADWVLTLVTGRAARAIGARRAALEEARRGLALAPGDPVLADRLAETLDWLGRPEDALVVARNGVERHPDLPLLSQRYAAILRRLGAAPWRQALADARQAWLEGRPAAATRALRQAAAAAPREADPAACWDVRLGTELARSLTVENVSRLEAVRGPGCSGD